MHKKLDTNRSIFLWNRLWNYSHSMIIKYASYAVFTLPIIAYLSDEIQHRAMSAGPFQISQTTRIVLSNLYFSSLLLIAAYFLTNFFCPEKIKKYPHVDDYFIFCLNIRNIVKIIQTKVYDLEKNRQAVGDFEVDSKNSAALKIIEKIVVEEFFDKLTLPATIYEEWSTENSSKIMLRQIVFILNFLGTFGIVVYVAWSLFSRINLVVTFSNV